MTRNQEIIRLHMLGLSYGRISGEMRISRNVVAGVINRSGLTDGGGKRRPGQDLTGKRFHSLVVIRRVLPNADTGCRRWLVRCDCGEEKVVHSSNLLCGGTKSCGCLHYRRAIREAA